MYEKVSTDLNFVAREEQVLDFWKKQDIFKKAQKQGEGKPDYTFYDGPPTANGKPHIGHVLTRSIKDLFPGAIRRWTAIMSCARPGGTRTACLWSWRWKSSSA